MNLEGEVDHVDRNRLNCTRENIREANRSQNNANVSRKRGSTSHYRGVRREVRSKKESWTARIAARGQQIHLGSFDCEEDAARAYNKAALEYFGEFAVLNPMSCQDAG
jgi:hypothetical protein